MGMYTGIRFKGYVKPEFRKEMSNIALTGDWNESTVPEFAEFGKIRRSSFIPCGALAYMPDEWEQAPYNEYHDGVPTDGFDRTYDEETGYWTFQCSLKNYEDEIESFFELIPFFIEKIEHLEYFYEEWDWSSRYDLYNGMVFKIDSHFVKYNDGYEEDIAIWNRLNSMGETK